MSSQESDESDSDTSDENNEAENSKKPKMTGSLESSKSASFQSETLVKTMHQP